jgi:hypothetical protein
MAVRTKNGEVAPGVEADRNISWQVNERNQVVCFDVVSPQLAIPFLKIETASLAHAPMHLFGF